VLRVRRAPAVDPAHPLRGRVIAVDPGHPPAGATGPTGLYEGDAVLAVANRLKALPEADGATVVMTRTTRDAVGLEDRPVTARRAGADAFVSVHLNAFPDGVNPFTAVEGSASYFYRGQSEPLARALQLGMVKSMGLPDQGVVFRSLSVVRQTWMPSVLCEGAFVIVPQQEAALRTAAFQEAYARGLADGLRAYFRALGTAR
jgi:N-acetylmuramoyl-L-alanine amidase